MHNYHAIFERMRSRYALNLVKSILKMYRDSNSDPSVAQPVCSRYTDCATAVLEWDINEILNYIFTFTNDGQHLWSSTYKYLRCTTRVRCPFILNTPFLC
jgi:hypothetical protein